MSKTNTLNSNKLELSYYLNPDNTCDWREEFKIAKSKTKNRDDIENNKWKKKRARRYIKNKRSYFYLNAINKKWGFESKSICSLNKLRDKVDAYNNVKSTFQRHKATIRKSTHNVKYAGKWFLKQGDVFFEEGSILKMIRRTVEDILQVPLSPKTQEKHIGIELEFFGDFDKEYLADKFIAQKLQNYVRLRDDGSIDPDNEDEHAMELNILVTEKNKDSILKRICQVLEEVDAHVNKSCGFHVHLDMRNRDRQRAFHNLIKSQPILYGMNPKSRATSGYCAKIHLSRTNLDRARLHVEDRYKGINIDALSKFNTIEVRMHSGTTDYEKIINWVDLLLKIIENEPVKQGTKNLNKFFKSYRIEPNLQKYITSRIEKFSQSPTQETNNNV